MIKRPEHRWPHLPFSAAANHEARLQNPMELHENEVHFWFTQLAEENPRIAEFRQDLSKGERERASRFHRPSDRCSYIISHGVLRELLSRYLGIGPQDVEYETGSHGKPALHSSCGDSSLQFNMSHTDGLAAFALTRSRQIGVDVERITRDLSNQDEIVANYFAPREADNYRSLPSEKKNEAFFNCWTRKESFIKATGDGLSYPLDSFEVTLRPGERAVLLAVRDSPAEQWSMESLEPLAGYAAAITAEAPWKLVDFGEFDASVYNESHPTHQSD